MSYPGLPSNPENGYNYSPNGSQFGQDGLQRSSYPAANYPSPLQGPISGMYGGIGFAEPTQRPSNMPGLNQSSVSI